MGLVGKGVASTGGNINNNGGWKRHGEKPNNEERVNRRRGQKKRPFCLI